MSEPERDFRKAVLVIAYTLLSKREHYKDPGPNYLDTRQKERTVRRLRDRIEQLGYRVNLELQTAAPA